LLIKPSAYKAKKSLKVGIKKNHTAIDFMSVDEIRGIIDAYTTLVIGIESKAKKDENRAYGGIIRAGKGELVESITKTLIEIAWNRLDGDPKRLSMEGKQIHIPIRREYLKRLDTGIRKHIEENITDYVYHYKPDVLVSIDGKPVLEIECKAYTENAMLKRILVDAALVKSQYPKTSFALLQLESQLGGDYSELKPTCFGSPSTHTLLSYFDIDLQIITLLEGERKVDQPIHKKAFFKPLTQKSLEIAILKFEIILKKWS